MNTIIGNLLPFGNFSLSVIGLVVTLCLLALIYQVGIIGIKHLLAFDTEDAPEFNMENKLFILMCKVFPFIQYQEEYKDRVEKLFEGWGIVQKYYTNVINNYYNITGTDHYTGEPDIKEYCIFKTKEDALEVSKNIFKDNSKGISINSDKLALTVLVLLSIDIIVFLLAFNFFYTSLTLTIVAMYYGIRTLAKKVWSNTKRISVSEDKITKLEGKE